VASTQCARWPKPASVTTIVHFEMGSPPGSFNSRQITNTCLLHSEATQSNGLADRGALGSQAENNTIGGKQRHLERFCVLCNIDEPLVFKGGVAAWPVPNFPSFSVLGWSDIRLPLLGRTQHD
jgi:hypothetical protein